MQEIVMDPEKRFLHNQEQRLALIRKHDKGNNLHDFWRDFRGKVALWKEKVEKLGHECKTSSERQLAMRKLENLHVDLKSLQKDTLTNFDLPVADLRILHNEISSCNHQLQSVRDIVCPPTRFVFARYRAAWNDKMSNAREVESEINENIVKIPDKFVTQGRIIHNLSHATIFENDDSTFNVNYESGTSSCMKLDLDTSASLVLSNLFRCNISIHGNYQLLHMIQLNECHVICSNRIEGAVHVTSCLSSELVCNCHQLRIHETKDLSCHVTPSSGPILEDSTGVIFHASPGDKYLCETKDFNWFQKIPSPNFVIVEMKEEL